MSVMVMPDDATPFGDVIQAGQIIINAQTLELSIAPTKLLSTDNLSSAIPLAVYSAVTIQGVDTADIRLQRDQMFYTSPVFVNDTFGISMADFGSNNAIAVTQLGGDTVFATPSIDAAPFNGKVIILVGDAGSSLVLQDEDNLFGSTLQLANNTNMTMFPGNTLVLIYYDGYWYEISRSENI